MSRIWRVTDLATIPTLQVVAPAPAIGVWSWDIRTNTFFWCPTTYRMHAVPQYAPTSWGTWIGSIHPDDREEVAPVIQKLDEIPEIRLSYRTAAGRLVVTRGVIVRDPEGNPIATFGTVLDITALRQAHAASVEVSDLVDADALDPDRVQELVREIRDTLSWVSSEKIPT